MDDLISRQTAIDALDDNITIQGITNALFVINYVKRVKQKLEQLPSALPKAQWMPYPANEPEEGKQYLVTVKYNGNLIVDLDDYYSYGWDDWNDAVIAWAELPKPYKDGET